MSRLKPLLALLALCPLILAAQPPADGPAEDRQMTQQMQRMQEHMQEMQQLMARLEETQDPQERQRLMREHRTLMQEGMTMMGRMMDGSMGQRGAGGQRQQSRQCPAGDTECQLEQMQAQQRMMGQRMGLMHQMMQQMMEQMEAPTEED